MFIGFVGLVLIVGMLVDVNVLIFEWICEEFDKGFMLWMVICNGFGWVIVIIVDVNIIILIIVMVLYVIGIE